MRKLSRLSLYVEERSFGVKFVHAEMFTGKARISVKAPTGHSVRGRAVILAEKHTVFPAKRALISGNLFSGYSVFSIMERSVCGRSVVVAFIPNN